MLELLHDQGRFNAKHVKNYDSSFTDFDIECVDVLIGKPETHDASGKIEILLDQCENAALERAARNV